MRLLLVDDNRRFAASLKKSLEEDGYSVDVALDGPCGEDAALSACLDLVVLDIMLPGKNGFEVCRALRAHKVTTPILI